MTPVTSVMHNTVNICIYLVAIVLSFVKKSEFSEIPTREGRLLLCGGELSLFLGPKCLGPLRVAERRTQVRSWEPMGRSGSRQTSPPEKHPKD